jgi:hypothetical protein
MLVFVLLIRGVLHKTAGTAGPSAPPDVAEAVIDARIEPVPDRAVPKAQPVSDGCIEVVDHFFGTSIDHCAPATARGQSTPAERRVQQHRADEAIRVIEANTPGLR